MRNLTYFLAAIVLTALASCNKDSEKSFYEVETKLDAIIPIASTNLNALKSESGQLNKEIPFSGSNEYELRELVDNNNQFLNIHRISPMDGAVLIIQDMKEEVEIGSLELHWEYKTTMETDYERMESIDLWSLKHSLVNESLQFDLDEIAAQLIMEIKNSQAMLRFSITGECNRNFSSFANLQIPVIIESEVLTPRFELF